MARKKLKCPKCDRRFSMPAHLARHISTTHTSGKKKKAAKKPTSKRAVRRSSSVVSRRAAAPGAVASPAAAHIAASLLAFRAELDAQIAVLTAQARSVDDAISALGQTAPARDGSPRKSGGSRAVGRAGSLKDFMVKVLRASSGPLSPKEIATSVVRAGYKSKAKDLTKAVSNAIAEMKGIKRLGFGKYTV